MSTRHPVFSAPRYAITALAAAVIFALTVSGCSLSNLLGSDRSASLPYEQQANTTDEILDALIHSMERGEHSCELFIREESLINADNWLNSLPGIEKIHCEYRPVDSGFNTLITMDYWDSYAIAYAGRSQDTSYLTKSQLILYEKYMEILGEYTSPEQSDCANELAIHDYLVTHINYDASLEASYNAYDALIKGKAICGGYAECFKTFMDLLGIENTTLSGTAGDAQHIWNAVRLDGDWYQVDVTWDDPVNATSIALDHAYFNLSDEDMAIDHFWEPSQYPHIQAEGTRCTYPSFAGLPKIASQAALNELIADCIHERCDTLEFTTTIEPDLKTSMSLADTTLTYAYRTAIRTDYTLYTIAFIYSS